MILLPHTVYDLGYARGYREGLHDRPEEQNFAYQSAEYERGYWTGLKEGRAARLRS